MAASADTGMAAASSTVIPVGLGASLSCPTLTYPAHAPLHTSNTASPGRNRVTRAPTVATSPASAIPGTPGYGLVSPVTSRITTGDHRTPKAAPTWTLAARTRTRTSSSLTTGLAIFRSSRTSSGGPYLD